jgi:hypothetical protein
MHRADPFSPGRVEPCGLRRLDLEVKVLWLSGHNRWL